MRIARNQFEQIAEVKELRARLALAEEVVAAARAVVNAGSLSEGGVLIKDVGAATDLQIALARYTEPPA